MTTSRRLSSLRKQRRRVLAKFKPSKKQRGGLFFISASTGKLVNRNARTRVFAVYVTARGRKIPLNPSGVGGLAGVRSHFPSAYDLSRTRFRKASARYKASIRARVVSAGTGQIHTLRGGRNGIELQQFITGLSRGIVRAAASIDTRARRNFSVRLAVTVEYGGRVETVVVKLVDLHIAYRHKLTMAEVVPYVRARVYGLVAEQLEERGLVVKGSAEHIRRLSCNKGKKPSKWKQPVFDGVKRRLYRWRRADIYEKRGYNTGELVTLRQVSYEISLQK